MFFSLLIALVNTVLDSVATIFFKKTLAVTTEISWYIDRFIAYITGNLVIGTILMIAGFGSFASLLDTKIAIMLVLYSISGMIGVPLEQHLYREEKMSVLLPYSDVGNLLVTFLVFFIFWGVSLVAFGFTIATIITVVLFSVDFRNHTIPKNLPLILLNQVRRAAQLMFLWYLLQHISNYTLFIYENFFWGLQLVVIILMAWLVHWDAIRRLPKSYYGYRLISVWLGAGTELLGYLIIGSVGLISSMLLGFLGMGISIALAYVLMSEVPTRKEIAQAVSVSVLALIGVFL